MKIIKNSDELAKLVDSHKDLHCEDEDVRIEFEPMKDELRDIFCNDLFLMDDNQRYNFNGRNFTGWDFTGRNFTGGDFTGGDFTGGNFTGWDFTGRNFTGRNFTGGDFTGRNFTGGDFTGGDFTGWDFTGRNFTGGDFTGGNISYYAFFNCYGSIKCKSYKGRRDPHSEPICLDGKIEIINEEKTELSMDEIAEKFNVDVKNLKIKK